MTARGWSKVTLWSCFALAAALCLQVVAASSKNDTTLHKHALVKEVQEGDTATLPCPSNDEEHRFLFWQLIDDTVIGPANHHSHANKFDYEVLSGDLSIKHASTADSGYYKCVSKGIKEPNFFILPVELIVKKDWEILWESDTTLNVLRVFLALIVMAVLGGIVFVVFKMRRNGYVKSDDLSDDDMPDELQDGPYHSTTQRNTVEDSMSLVDTELPRALNSMYTDRL